MPGILARADGGIGSPPPHIEGVNGASGTVSRKAAVRILLASHAAELGGAEFGLLDVAQRFGRARCDVLLFADGALRQALEARGIKVFILSAGEKILGVRRQGGAMRMLASVPTTMAIAVRIAKMAKSYDLIYANSQKAAFASMLAGPLARKPVIWHLHDILSAAHFGWLQRYAIASLSKLATRAVIVVSQAARDALVASGGKASGISVIHNGIDPAPYAGLQGLHVEALRTELGLPQGRLIGLFGRITAWKGQRVLIEALPLLPNTHALIVGSAMFGEDAELAFLQDLAARLNVSDRVHFLGYRDDAPKLMRAVDLVVHCSTAPEPFGRVIVEALFAGTAILAADSGATGEILGNEPGWRVQPGDPKALATEIDAFFATDPALRRARVAAMRARVLEKFALPRMLDAIETLVARVTSR